MVANMKLWPTCLNVTSGSSASTSRHSGYGMTGFSREADDVESEHADGCVL